MSYKIKSGTEMKAVDKQTNNEVSLTPKLPFSMLIVGGKGAGKSNALLNMLLSKDILAQKFNKIIYISPTVLMDRKIKNLEGTKNLTAINILLNNELKKLKKSKKIFDVDIEDEERNTSNIEFYDEIDMNMINELCEYQKQIINIFNKQTADNILLILDDTASSKIWKNSNFIKTVFNSRHYKISIIITTQAYNSISKPIRMNNSILVLFETANVKELDNIYSENKTSLSFQEFSNICKNVFETQYNFLILNYQNPRKNRLQIQFKEFIEY